MNSSITRWTKIKKTILMASDFCRKIGKIFTQSASVQVILPSLAGNNGDTGSHCGTLWKGISHSGWCNMYLMFIRWKQPYVICQTVSFLISLPCLYSFLYYYAHNLQLKKIIVYMALYTGTNFISKLNGMIITNESEIANKWRLWPSHHTETWRQSSKNSQIILCLCDCTLDHPSWQHSFTGSQKLS